MTAARTKLPHRRACETFDIEVAGLRYRVTIGRFPNNGQLAEIFIGSHRAGSQADANAKDSAVVASIALQYGVPLEVIRHALLRDASGKASGPLGAALDRIAEVDP